jgi:hypothetical protein
MSLRGAEVAKAPGRRGNLVAIQGGYALATRLLRCNDIFICLPVDANKVDQRYWDKATRQEPSGGLLYNP